MCLPLPFLLYSLVCYLSVFLDDLVADERNAKLGTCDRRRTAAEKRVYYPDPVRQYAMMFFITSTGIWHGCPVFAFETFFT